jgi:hypothetical protein
MKILGKIGLAALTCVLVLVLTGGAVHAQPKAITSCASIGAAGSYILKGNLTDASGTGVCIYVSASNVTIDLDGFMIKGSAGSAVAIDSSANNLTVTNGAIVGFGAAVFAANGARISNLIVMSSSNGENYAMYLENSAQVSDTIFLNNDMTALTVGQNSLITHCIFAGSGFAGLMARGNGVVVTENSIDANGSGGVSTEGQSTVEGNAGTNNPSYDFLEAAAGTTFDTNAAANSTSAGIQCGFPGAGKILGNCLFEGNASQGNKSYGLADSGGSVFRSNTADSNASYGFYADKAASFDGNTSDNNEIGFQVTCPANLLGNTAEINTTAPFQSSSAGCQLKNNLGF